MPRNIWLFLQALYESLNIIYVSLPQKWRGNMSIHRFNLRLTEESKNILDQVERGKKNEFINNAIEKYEEENLDSKVLKELKSISSSLSIIAECLQKTTKTNGVAIVEQQMEERVEDEEDHSMQKKLSDFAMKYLE